MNSRKKTRAITRALVSSFCLIAVAGSALAAPGPSGVATDRLLSQKSTATEAWREKSPTLPPPKSFSLPAVKTYKLDNGITVKLVEDHRVPYVTAFLGIRAGTVLDNPDKRGVAEMTSDMLNEGTKTRKSKEIAEETDFIGGSLGFSSDYDFTIMSASSLSNYTDRLFALMSDVLLNPSFPEDELKLKQTNWVQELTMKRSDPDFLLQERFRKVMFGPHPYGVVSPKPEMIASITRDDLKKFYKANFIPNDAILVVLGDFDQKQIENLIAAAFGKWEKGDRTIAKLPEVAPHKSRRIYLVDRPDSVQSSIVVGNLGIKKTDPDYFASKVMNQILGGSAHSRLFLNIREQKGYTYGAYSSVAARIEPDAFSAGADVRTEVTAPSLKEFIFELERMPKDAVTKEELDDAKNYLAGQFQLGLETQSGLAQRLLEVSLYDLPKDYLETYSENIMAITPEQVQKAAQKVIHSDDLIITVVGDAKKVRSGLEPYGKIELYDLNGELSTNPPVKGPDS